ncbi:MAG TPA: rRNA maturation RNase YbeY [Bacillota bacterium]|nr:rRNA maturation RNase YbeY [Bacillota bacterium]
MHIDFVDEQQYLSKEHVQLITDLLELASTIEETPQNSEVSITIVSDDEIQEINREYRGVDRPTDVISFEMQDDLKDLPMDIQHQVGNMLGDIIVSIHRAREQATEYNHSVEREVGFLVVHGFLHLLGYTHDSEEEEQQMFAKQKEILDQYGLKRE